MSEDNNQDQKSHYEAARAMSQKTLEDKARMRKQLAALSFDEKMKVLEKLRDRERVLAEARRKLRESKGTAGDWTSGGCL